MSEPTPSKTISSEKLAATVKLAVECKHGLRQLGEFQEACAIQFRVKERELIEQLSRLQTLIEEYLPIAGEELTPDTGADENRETAPLAAADGTEAGGGPPSGPTHDAGEKPDPGENQGVRSGDPDAEQTGGVTTEGGQESRQTQATGPKGEPGNVPGSPKKSTDELKELLRSRYPALVKLAGALKNATSLTQLLSSGQAPRATLEQISGAYHTLQKKLIGLLDNQDAGRTALLEEGRRLMNQLQEVDRRFQTPQQLSTEHLKLLRTVRDNLWSFIQEATNHEYREIAPPANVKISDWLRSESYSPEDKYIECQVINHAKYPKDAVIKTLRPGYVRMTLDRRQIDQVIVKAFVQIATGSA